MVVEINAEALGAFRKVDFGNADAIVNLGGEKGIQQKGTLGSVFGKMFRSGKTKEAINAIVTQATAMGKADFSVAVYKQKLAVIKQDLGLAGLYDAQLDEFNTKHSTPDMQRLFIHAEKALAFLEQMEFGKPVVNSKTGKTYYEFKNSEDLSPIRVNPELMLQLEFGDDETNIKGERFQYRFPGTASDEYQDIVSDTIGDYNTGFSFQLSKALGGEVIHLERAGFDSSSNDIEPLKKYISQTLQLFAQKMIDVYFECKSDGKMEAFEKHCKSPGACLEEKGLQLTRLQERLFSGKEEKGENDLSAAEKAEIERIADLPVGDKAPPRGGSDLIYGAIDALSKVNNDLYDSENWADFSEGVKEKLMSPNTPMAQIVRPVFDEERNQYKFEPVVENGNPVVRRLNAEDIDAIGPACLHNINIV